MMKLLLLILCISAVYAQDRDIIVNITADMQKAYSFSRLKVGELLDEKHTLKENLAGGEVRLGFLYDKHHRFYAGMELGHQRRGLKHYGAFFEYNATPYFNRYWSAILGTGVGYAFATLNHRNVMISGQSPGSLHFKGFNYFAKGGIIFSYNRNIELELSVKAKHLLLGNDSGQIDIEGNQPVTLNMNKTFTLTAAIGLNFKF